MKTLSEMPKQIIISRPMIQVQLGIRPLYVLEVVSMRTLKYKCIEVRSDHEDRITAPNGYRISRIWKDCVTVANELPID